MALVQLRNVDTHLASAYALLLLVVISTDTCCTSIYRYTCMFVCAGAKFGIT